MQLNPHFLFNTLNAISGLMLNDVATANRMLSRLGDLLRLTLETRDQQEVVDRLAQRAILILADRGVDRVDAGDDVDREQEQRTEYAD